MNHRVPAKIQFGQCRPSVNWLIFEQHLAICHVETTFGSKLIPAGALFTTLCDAERDVSGVACDGGA